MLHTAASHYQTTLAERYSALFGWLRAHAIATAPADRDAVAPVWELVPLGDYRMTACAICGEVVDPLWRLCRHCGNPMK